MRIFLFSWDFELLGEFRFDAGKLQHFSLSQGGELVLGEHVRHWQTRGITLVEHASQYSTEKTQTITSSRQILLNHAEAEAAFLCWAAAGHYPIIPVTDRLLTVWQKLCLLPLHPEERFAALNALRMAPFALYTAWEKAIDEELKTSKNVST